MKSHQILLLICLVTSSFAWKCNEPPPVSGPPTPCEPPTPPPIDIIPPDDEDQRCHEILTLLSADGASVDNSCSYDTVNGSLYYHFNFFYVTPFVYDDTCLDQVIKFEDIVIPEGSGFTYQYTFDGVHIVFTVPHLDLETAGCTKIVEDDQYIWQCDISLTILYKGNEQYTYSFIMTSAVSRYYENVVTLNVAKNVVIGDCCVNELNIQTVLNFCSDLSCTTYLPSPLSIVRKDLFYVEHKITSPEFQYYYLHRIQLKVGDFYPVIMNTVSNLPGKIRWELQVNVAMNGMVVDSIVQIDDVPERRFLEEKKEVIGEDYYVKAQSGKILVTDAANEQKTAKAINQDNGNKSNDNNQGLVGAVVGVSIFAALLLVAIGAQCLKIRGLRKQQQHYNKTHNEVQPLQTLGVNEN